MSLQARMEESRMIERICPRCGKPRKRTKIKVKTVCNCATDQENN